MDETILKLYKDITGINDRLKLARIFPEQKQAQCLENLMDKCDKDEEDKTLFAILKIIHHLIQHGATDVIRNDAFTSFLIFKSFSIKQDKQVIQQQCFIACFVLLYARYISQEQKAQCVDELTEFYLSKKDQIRRLLIVFYFDDKHNPEFNLFKIKPLTDLCFQYLCDSYIEIINSENTTLPRLPNDDVGISLDTLEQRFFNQFVYGELGLHAKNYSKDQSKLVMDTLVTCAGLDHDRSHSAKKGLIKHLDFLITKQHSAELKENVDQMIIIQEDIDYILKQLDAINFGKLDNQLKKILARLN